MKASLARLLLGPSCVLVALSCGGSTSENRGSGGGQTGGALGSGGSNAGGSNAGSSGSAGGGVGGSGIGGSGQGGAGTGGASQERCLLPAETGPCEAAFPVWYHDPVSGVCLPFTYGGCQGNDNRFESREACESACNGVSPNLDECQVHSDCTLTSPGCCAGCEPVDERMLVAVNRHRTVEFAELHGCSGVACGPCPEVDELERTSQNFVPICRAGQCTVLDIRTTTATECEDASDCRLRDGATCCEGCDGQGLVAHDVNASLEPLVCDDEFPGCLACIPPIPEEYFATCVSGRCRVARN